MFAHHVNKNNKFIKQEDKRGLLLKTKTRQPNVLISTVYQDEKRRIPKQKVVDDSDEESSYQSSVS